MELKTAWFALPLSKDIRVQPVVKTPAFYLNARFHYACFERVHSKTVAKTLTAACFASPGAGQHM